LGFWLAARGDEKTHDCCQPWVLVEIRLRPTSSPGVAYYDDHR